MAAPLSGLAKSMYLQLQTRMINGTTMIFLEKHNRSFINRECYLPYRPNFLSAFLALFEVFPQFKGMFKEF